MLHNTGVVGGYILLHKKYLFGMTCKNRHDAQEVLQNMVNTLRDLYPTGEEVSRDEAKEFLQHFED